MCGLSAELGCPCPKKRCGGISGPGVISVSWDEPLAQLHGSSLPACQFSLCNPPCRFFPQQEHTDILRSLRFTLAFVHYVMEIAALKGNSSEMSASAASEYQLQESVVADQISLLSREWR